MLSNTFSVCASTRNIIELVIREKLHHFRRRHYVGNIINIIHERISDYREFLLTRRTND